MRRWLGIVGVFLAAEASCLQTEPWFGNAWEFTFRNDYEYSRYSKVQHAVHQLKSPSNDQLLLYGMDVATLSNFQGEVEVEFADTPRQRWGLRSTAFQLRYLWLDDLLGDPVDLTTGISFRLVDGHSVRDVSSPYHFYFNGEMNVSVGKEWSQGRYWRYRPYAFLGVGTANRGYPWLRPLLVFQANYEDRHRYKIFTEGYFGFGPQKRVNIEHFQGYARIRHESIDIGANYTYLFDIWGSLTLEYVFRPFARSFPEYVNFFLIRYELPFSFF